MPRAYLADAVSEEDAIRLRFEIGSCQGQAAAEALAILVALRAWLPLWGSCRTAVAVRSDSTAALGALGKLGSSSPAVAIVAREVALDIACSRYGVDVWQHVRAEFNTEADALSRWAEHGKPRELPVRLGTAEQTMAPVRSDDWWLASSAEWRQRVGLPG